MSPDWPPSAPLEASKNGSTGYEEYKHHLTHVPRSTVRHTIRLKVENSHGSSSGQLIHVIVTC